MSSLNQSFESATRSVSLQIPRKPVSHRAEPRPRRSSALMRKYETSALMPDLSISFKSQIAPAQPLFEEACTAFARGTLIPTVRGPVAIEDLLPGDYVESSAGAQPVTWIGSTTYVPGIPDDATTLASLSRITADSFGPGRPMVDVVVGPAAHMVMRRDRLKSLIGRETVLVPVADFADGDRIVEVTPVGSVQLYHLMLGRHATMRIGGIEMESYHPGKSLVRSMGESTAALFLSLFPNIGQAEDFGELSLTRTTREVIDSLTSL